MAIALQPFSLYLGRNSHLVGVINGIHLSSQPMFKPQAKEIALHLKSSRLVTCKFKWPAGSTQRFIIPEIYSY